MSPRKASCPACGAELEFRNPATVFVVCASCRGASYRKDLDFESLGKVAEVAPLDSLLDLGTTGRSGGKGWTAVGQVQLDHGAGPWNEWCLALDGGGHAWLAEAQGALLWSRTIAPVPVPPLDRLAVGDPVDLAGAGSFVVAEIGEGRVVAARGEFPEVVRPGAARRYADLRGRDGAFATLDYGDDRTCDAIHVGREVRAADVGLDPAKAPAPAERRTGAARLQCAKCAGEIVLRDPEGASRVSCRSCGSLLDAGDPSARILGVAARVKMLPRIPLGARGRIRDLDVEVIAFLVRSVTVAGIRYPWSEYLLRVRGGGYRWLAESRNHWNFIEPLNLGDVRVGEGAASWKGKAFRHFQGGKAVVDGVLGEVYWEVRVGEEVRSEDHVAPPLLLSVETSGKERNVSLGTYLEPEEVRAAFGLETMRVPEGVAPNQPNPHRANLWKWWGLAGAFALADFLVTRHFAGKGMETWTFPCCLTLPALLLPAVVCWTRSSGFERKRWEESDHAPDEDAMSPARTLLVLALFGGLVLFAVLAGGD